MPTFSCCRWLVIAVVLVGTPVMAEKTVRLRLPLLQDKDTPLHHRLGRDWAEGWIELARARADAGLFGGPDCAAEGERGDIEKKLCRSSERRFKRIERARARIDKAYADGKLNDYAPYPNRPESHGFQLLHATLLDPDPRMRWEALNALVTICETEPQPGRATEHCAEELQRAAVTVVRNDEDSFNRHFALELLVATDSLGQEGTRELRGLAERAPLPQGECRSILDQRHSSLRLEALAKGYHGNAFSCESTLARRALQVTAGP